MDTNYVLEYWPALSKVAAAKTAVLSKRGEAETLSVTIVT